MEINSIIEELEQLKGYIWQHVEEEETPLHKKIKDTTNLLLDLLESLEE